VEVELVNGSDTKDATLSRDHAWRTGRPRLIRKRPWHVPV